MPADSMARRPRAAPPLRDAETALIAEERSTPHGPIWVGVAHYPDVYRHGRMHVATGRAWDPAGLAWLAREPAAAAVGPERWAFLDVETTGLGAHAGVYAFLVGIGWLVADGFRLEQFLLRDPSDEPALLHAVAERLAGFAGLVTFNGKTFDVPLLATRAALLRRAPLHALLAHCDLLHAARRIWSDGATSCRLAALETRWLGLQRRGDIEGRFIPPAYMQYLRDGRGEDLDPILGHNRADLLSLALLTAEAARFLGRVEQVDEPRRDGTAMAADRLRAARLHVQAGDPDRARSLLERCLAAAPPATVRQSARALLAALRKRAGDLDSACGLWEAMIDEDPALVEPVEELAKVQEHRRRDPAGALLWVERRLGGPDLDAVSRQLLLHRRTRLARRLGGAMLPAASENHPASSSAGLRRAPLPGGSGIANLRSPI